VKKVSILKRNILFILVGVLVLFIFMGSAYNYEDVKIVFNESFEDIYDLDNNTKIINYNLSGENITGSYFFGDGSSLTGVSGSGGNIFDQDLNTTDGVHFRYIVAKATPHSDTYIYLSDNNAYKYGWSLTSSDDTDNIGFYDFIHGKYVWTLTNTTEVLTFWNDVLFKEDVTMEKDLTVDVDLSVGNDLNVDGITKLYGNNPYLYFYDTDNPGSEVFLLYSTVNNLFIRNVNDSADIISIYDGAKAMSLNIGGSTTTFNDYGNDLDFKIQGDDIDTLFYVNAGDDRIGVNDSTPDSGYLFDVNGDIQCNALNEVSDSRIKNVLFEVSSKPNALRRFCNELSIVMYNPIVHNETILELDENGSVVDWFLEFNEVESDFVDVGIVAQDVWDLCNNFSDNQNINDKLCRSVVKRPVDDSKELWGVNYRMISLLYMENNKLRTENIEAFLMGYGYDPEVSYG